MNKIVEKILKTISDLILSGIKAPIEDIKKNNEEISNKLSSIEQDIKKLKEDSHNAKAFDLALGEDRIFHLIRECIKRGYRTESDMMLIPNIYKTYVQRGGNHSASIAYNDFCNLITEEEFIRLNNLEANIND